MSRGRGDHHRRVSDPRAAAALQRALQRQAGGRDRSPDGALTNRRTFADLGHRQPDGICADASGAIWTGCFNTGEFLRVLDGGQITDRIAFDGCGVACTIGGPDGHTLFCTVYCGPVDDLIAGMRKAAVYRAQGDQAMPLRP